MPALVVIEVPGPAHEQPLASPGELDLRWIQGEGLVEAVTGLDLPAGEGHAFIHGEATAVRLIRRHLVLERGMPVEMQSATGYWKERRTDEEWRADKKQWLAQAEADLQLS